MSIVLDGSTGLIVSGNTNTLSGITVGRGAGSVSTNTAVGASALAANTSATNNTAVGYQSGYVTTTGIQNSFFGASAGNTVTTGQDNVLLGYSAGRGITTNSYNVAIGTLSFGSNSNSGAHNTGVGYFAGYANTSGSYNTALGDQALSSNTTASNNTAVGYQAGYSNSTGNGNNTSVGYQALYSNTTGPYNVAMGKQAGYSNSTGQANAFFGYQAGYSTTGDGNTFVGAAGAGPYGSGYLVTTGSRNTILGAYNGNQGSLDIRTSSNYIVLSDGDGNPTAFWDSTGTINLGGQGRNNDGRVQLWGKEASGAGPTIIGFTGTLSTYTVRWWTGSRSYVKGGTDYDSYCVASGAAASGGVYLAAAATSWSSASDERLKDIIEPITDAANKVSTLRAVIGKYKTDEEGTRRSFLIAQDVQAVLPEAITEGRNAKDDEKDYLGVAYTDVIPLLVAAIKELKTDLDATKAELAALKAPAA